MKKTLLKFLCAFLCIPLIFLCGCSGKKKTKLGAIDIDTYFSSTTATTIYYEGQTVTTKTNTSNLTLKKPNKEIIDRYESFEIKANAEWIYKMYIDYIYFYVYTSESSSSELVVNISITNAVAESDIGKELDENAKYETQASLIPQKDGSTLCEVAIKRVIATATGATLTFDILNSVPQVFLDENGKDNGLKWIIYGLEIHGESRAYSGK